jgi:hypothetical protein
MGSTRGTLEPHGDARVSAVATGVTQAPGLFLGLLLEGFYIAPRGMGGIPVVATEDDIDELAAAIGRGLASKAETAAATAT